MLNLRSIRNGKEMPHLDDRGPCACVIVLPFPSLVRAGDKAEASLTPHDLT
jgi:hypothetical protein